MQTLEILRNVWPDQPRAGEKFRLNSDRFFHVMGQGWYVQMREGIHGPYLTRYQANSFVLEMVQNSKRG